MKRLPAVAALAALTLLLLAVPAVANVGEASVDCDTANFGGRRFPAGTTTFHFVVTGTVEKTADVDAVSEDGKVQASLPIPTADGVRHVKVSWVTGGSSGKAEAEADLHCSPEDSTTTTTSTTSTTVATTTTAAPTTTTAAATTTTTAAPTEPELPRTGSSAWPLTVLAGGLIAVGTALGRIHRRI